MMSHPSVDTNLPVPPPAMNHPVFVAGCMRSGTTLLMQLLDCSSNIVSPPSESYFMANFYGSTVRRYTSKVTAPQDCIEPMSRLAHGSYKAFCKPEWVRNEAAKAGSYAEVFDIVNREMAHQIGKNRWADKTPGNEFFAKDILELFPSAKIIYVLRDYRRVIVSKRDKEMSDHGKVSFFTRFLETLRAAWLWRESVRAHLWNLTSLDNTRYLTVRYEELIADPVQMMKRLSSFLDEPLDEVVYSLPEGGFGFRPLSNLTYIRRMGRSNSSEKDKRGTKYKIMEASRNVNSLHPLEKFVIGCICRGLAELAGYEASSRPTSYKSFGKREKWIANRLTQKGKFWFGQSGQRLDDPVMNENQVMSKKVKIYSS